MKNIYVIMLLLPCTSYASSGVVALANKAIEQGNASEAVANFLKVASPDEQKSVLQNLLNEFEPADLAPTEISQLRKRIQELKIDVPAPWQGILTQPSLPPLPGKKTREEQENAEIEELKKTKNERDAYIIWAAKQTDWNAITPKTKNAVIQAFLQKKPHHQQAFLKQKMSAEMKTALQKTLKQGPPTAAPAQTAQQIAALAQLSKTIGSAIKTAATTKDAYETLLTKLTVLETDKPKVKAAASTLKQRVLCHRNIYLALSKLIWDGAEKNYTSILNLEMSQRLEQLHVLHKQLQDGHPLLAKYEKLLNEYNAAYQKLAEA